VRQVSIKQHEDHLAFQISALGLPKPEREFVFHPARKWRFDFAWPLIKVAAEVDGGTWGKKKSGHTTGSGFAKDCKKGHAAAILGWRILHFPTDQIKNGQAVLVIEEILKEIK